MFTKGFQKTAGGKEVAKHLLRYRRDYLVGAGVGAASVSAKAALDRNKLEKNKGSK